MIAVDAVAAWRVWVTESDLREARAAWLEARDAGAPADRVLDLLEELERMTRTATLQAMGDPGARGETRGAAVAGSARVTGPTGMGMRVPSPGGRRVLASRLPATG